jgi:hypothetical protein
VLQFHRHAKGVKAGDRLTVADPAAVPLAEAARFAVYRPAEISIAVGDKLRMTANGKTLDGHRLNNGAVYRVAGFDRQGNVQLDNGWKLAAAWGHWNHAYVSTSWASQSRTVDKVILSQSALSRGASSREQFYVSLTRARQEAAVYTDDRQQLRDMVQRSEAKATAHDVARSLQGEQRRERQAYRRRQRHYAKLREAAALRERLSEREGYHAGRPVDFASRADAARLAAGERPRLSLG